MDIERVQKCFLHLTLGKLYTIYEAALGIVGLKTLEDRRRTICLKFALKASKHPKHGDWFVPTNLSRPESRQGKQQLKPPLCRMKRLEKDQFDI